jgi:dihydroneopterin aldolase
VTEKTTHHGNHNTISLKNYTALQELTENYRKRPQLAFEETTDYRLFTCFNHKDVSKIVKKAAFVASPAQTLESYKEAVLSFFSNDNLQKLKIKVFNNVFPHALFQTREEIANKHLIRTGKEYKGNWKTGVNVIYLQRFSKFSEEVLSEYIAGNALNEAFVENIIRKCYLNQVSSQLAQLPDDEKRVLTLRLVGNPDGADLGAPSKFEKKFIVELEKEIHLANNMVIVLEKGLKANPETDMKKCYDTYLEICEKINSFFEKEKTNIIEKTTVAGFIKWYVVACQFCEDVFRNWSLVENVANRVTPLAFRREPRKYIKSILEKPNSEEITARFNEWLDSVKTVEDIFEEPYDFAKVNVFQHFADLFEAPLIAEHKARAGAAIVDYVREKVDELRKVGFVKQREIVIYIE